MIIVTGGAGFIGSNLVLGLNRIGRSDILLVDDLRQGIKHRNLNQAQFNDILGKQQLLDELPNLSDVSVIFHQGACADTTESDGRYMMKNNYEYSKSLLHFALEHGVPYLYASSAAVYGSGKSGFREEPGCEDPLNIYGFSKLAFDNYVRRLLPQARSPIVGLRYFNVYGPNEYHKARMASVALHLFEQLHGRGKMQLFQGSEQFLRDFIHVDDAIAVNLAFMSRDVSGIFNCGTGQARAFTEIAATLRARHGRGELEFIPFPADLTGKYQQFTQADLQRLRAAGFDTPFLPLEEGVTRYYQTLLQSGRYG